MHFKGFFNKGVFFKWNQCSWILVSSTRMTWTWLSACAGKAVFMPPGCSLAQGGRGGGGKEGGQRERPRAVGQLNIL